MASFLTGKRKFFLLISGILFAANVFTWREIFDLAGSRLLEVNFLNVGQGDAIFIEAPQASQILIDGGQGSSVLEKLAAKIPFWDKSLDVVILTHSDKDHVDGLINVLNKYSVDCIVWSGAVKTGGTYQKWLEAVDSQKKRGAKIVIAEAGQKIKAGNAVIEILHPFENIRGKDFGEKNNDSGVVSRLDFGKASFLFAADVSSVLEKKMIVAKKNLSAEILKVAHHGSKYSTSEEFLMESSPKIAVISSGKNNSYGHPTEEVLQKLKKFGIRVFRTDEYGDIEMLSDGNSIRINK